MITDKLENTVATCLGPPMKRKVEEEETSKEIKYLLLANWKQMYKPLVMHFGYILIHCRAVRKNYRSAIWC